MNDKEWLIEKLYEWGNKENDGVRAESIADYLLENGVIVPPCKVGDRVWELRRCDDGMYRIFPMTVTKILPYGSVRWIKDKEPTVWNIYATSDYTYMYKDFYDFGETVFLTKEEAEKALEEITMQRKEDEGK